MREYHPLMPAIPALLPALLLAASAAAQPALTIYNGGYAVVRETVPLELHAGVNLVNFSGATLHLEPDSVVLRDPAGRVALRVLEQNYRADTISPGLLLSLNEGKTLDFVTRDGTGHEVTVRGKVIRSGYVPRTPARPGVYGQAAWPAGGETQPIVEVNGQLRFSLPGEPVFPALGDDAILQPRLTWQIAADAPAKVAAELSYVTGGLRWEAAYNLIAGEKEDTLEIVGWVTMENQSGKAFVDAHLKLMAGDVNKLPAGGANADTVSPMLSKILRESDGSGVVEKAFDEFHLYTLPRPATLHDRETKQVEFIRAVGVPARTLYIYRGFDPGPYRNWDLNSIRGNQTYGLQSNPKVWVIREFVNSAAHGLGQPLPLGRTRFYRRDEADGRLEFTGENRLDHTAKDETVRLYTGDAFDVVGERVRTNFVLHNSGDAADESFAITLRNHKAAPVEVRVGERLYRWVNWTIPVKSHDYAKVSAQEIEFPVTVPAGGETVVRYTVHYDWK